MSAYYTKYRTEFADISKLVWKIDIQEYLSSQPAIINLTSTGDPITIEFNAEGDEFNDPIRGSKAIINVMSQTDFALEDLYTVEDFHFKVLVYAGASLYWQGFITVGEGSEPYDCPPYPVQITANDGLSYLKQYLFKYTTSIIDDTYYEGRRTESQILIDILAKISITGFTEYINLYEITHLDSTDDSPLDQTKIDVDVFKDMTCYDVLYYILTKYNAVIRQRNGSIVIYRPIELTDTTVYGRIFTSATAKSSTTLTPEQLINRAGSSSSLKQLPDSTKWTKKPVKKLTALQNFVYKQSWINNWDFKANTYITEEKRYAEWLYGGGMQVINPINYYFSGEKDGQAIGSKTSFDSSKYVYQEFATYALISGNIFTLQFDYISYNPLGDESTSIYIGIESISGGHYLYVNSELTCAWSASFETVDFEFSAPTGISNWTTFKRSFVGLPESGQYVVKLYCPVSAHSKVVGIKNIKFNTTADNLVVKWVPDPEQKRMEKWVIKRWGHIPMLPTIEISDNAEIVQKEYIITNSLKGNNLDLSFILGDAIETNIDNVLEQFAGSLSVVSAIGGTGAVARVDKLTLVVDVDCNVIINGYNNLMVYNTDKATTCADFVANYGTAFGNVTLSHTPSDTFFFATANIAGTDFIGTTDSDGCTVVNITDNDPGASPTLVDIPSSTWNRIGATENLPLLQIVAGEIGSQYSRPKKLMQMNVYDPTNSGPVLNIIGNIQDSLYQLSAVNRVFVFNKGTLNVKRRVWNCDLCELI